MSNKDYRYKRECPICRDTLPGTDDGLEVYECLKQQLEEGMLEPDEEPNCTLCGEPCSRAEAEAIIARGEPLLRDAEPGEFDE